MVELIINRDRSHLRLLRRLSKIPWRDMTDEQKNEWYKVASLAAYNFTDLNRVETAVAELAIEYELDLSIKTNWTVNDYPTPKEMNRYLSNLKAIQAKANRKARGIVLPDTMDHLTLDDANNIELMLQYAYEGPADSAVLGAGSLGSMLLGNS